MLSLNRNRNINHRLKRINIANLAKVIFITTILTLIICNNANANMFNKFKKGFYFEKYKTADEAKEALLKLHPIGSDVGELVKTLDIAGAKCVITDGKMNEEQLENDGSYKVKMNVKNKISDPKDYFNCHYTIRGWQMLFFCSIDWTVNVRQDEYQKVSVLEVYKNLNCL